VELSPSQRRALYDDGYVVLPGVVPPAAVQQALRAINSSLGARGMHPDMLPQFRAQTYCPEITGTEPISDLMNRSPLFDLCESAVGRGQLRPVRGGQVALRFPTEGQPAPPGPHIDGMYTPTNGVPKGTIANFTALAGVFLSDVPEPFCGNFSVWPGTHRLFEEHFRRVGPQALLEGMPKVEMPPCRQITARAGDAILCHYQLAHGVAGNGSPHVRYAIFFRLHHVDHESVHWECMTDIWREWAGMRQVVAAAEPGRPDREG
jgi:hypothetical protein